MSCNKQKSKGKAPAMIMSQKEEKLKTSKAAEAIMLLREAIYDREGRDRDVLADFGPMAKYDRNGLDLNIEFAAAKALKKDEGLFQQVIDLTRSNMADVYAWDEMEATDELEDNAGRFLLVRERGGGALVGAAQFRFTLQGELHSTCETHQMIGEAVLLVFDVQLEPRVQRKGVGTRLMQLLELVCRKYKLAFLQARVHDGNDGATAFMASHLKGFSVEAASAAVQADADFMADIDFSVFSKTVNKTRAAAAAEKQVKQAEVLALAASIAKMQAGSAAAAPAPPAPAKTLEDTPGAAAAAPAVVEPLD